MNKYGFSSKIAKNINKKFHTFVKGINDSWTGDISKKKQERQERRETSKKKKPKSTSKTKEALKDSIKSSEIKTDIMTNMNQVNNNNKKNNIPNTNKKNNTITADNNPNKYDEIYKRLQNKRDINNLKALKRKKEQEELDLCTFQPNIHKLNNSTDSREKDKNKLNKKQIDNNFEKLYQDGKASYIQKKKGLDPDFEDNIDNKINCTFRPVIHQFNNDVFSKNPIKEELQRFEKLGDQKMNALGNKEYTKPMNFYIESKINKEDIVDRVIPERYSLRNSVNERENETALLKVEVNLDENNNTDKIIIYPGDDVKEKTTQFCLKHRLSEEKKNTLLNIITEKIEETKNGGKIIFEGRKSEQNQMIQESKKNEVVQEINNKVKDGEND